MIICFIWSLIWKSKEHINRRSSTNNQIKRGFWNEINKIPFQLLHYIRQHCTGKNTPLQTHSKCMRDTEKERSAPNTKPKKKRASSSTLSRVYLPSSQVLVHRFSFSLAILDLSNLRCDKCCNTSPVTHSKSENGYTQRWQL